MSRPQFCCALFVALVLPGAGAQIVAVPEDWPDIQTAIDQAPPGATVVIHGGEWYTPLVIDKAITLIGDPRPLLLPNGPSPTARSPITLAGPGNGIVRLVNIEVGGMVVGNAYTACEPGIQGGGFAALQVFDSLIAGPPWAFAYNEFFPGADAIDVTVPLLWIERCTVRGADAIPSSNNTFTVGFDAGTAIRAPASTVVVLDSIIRGGGSDMAYYTGPGGCPATCPGGQGGDGVIAAHLVHASSSFTAGPGTTWFDELGAVLCCTAAAGTAKVTNTESALAGDLSGSGIAAPGQPYQLDWSAPGPVALLFLSTVTGAAPQLGSPGLFLAPPLIFLGAVATPAGATLMVPTDAALAGVAFAIQLHGSQGWSRPLAGVIVP